VFVVQVFEVVQYDCVCGTGIRGGPNLGRYDGEFDNGYLNGKGRFRWPDGEVRDRSRLL